MEIRLSGLAGELCGLRAKGGECIAELKRSFKVWRGGGRSQREREIGECSMEFMIIEGFQGWKVMKTYGQMMKHEDFQ